MKRAILSCSLFLAACRAGGEAPESGVEHARYLRVSSQGSATECMFAIRRSSHGVSIESVTTRGSSTMTVAARYDPTGALLDAQAQETGRPARVRVSEGSASVERPGLPAQEFTLPNHVIVTSAPDWTDAFLLCRRYDRRRAGAQEFPGLWIHPLEPAQRLTFSAEHIGGASIEHEGKARALDRLVLRLRGNSLYAAWADEAGRMIKLTPLPFKPDNASYVLEGFEGSARALVP